MIGLLRRAAAEHGDRPAVVGSRGVTTYADLLDDAVRVAGALRASSVDRLAVLDHRPERVLAVLCGAAAAGSEVCVYPLAADDTLIAEHRQRFGHDVLVTSRETLLAAGAGATDDLLAHAADQAPDADDATMLVMTTGTTGVPKGVRHSWERLLTPTARIGSRPDDRWLLAYGLNQFGGLQLLLQVVASRATMVVTDELAPLQGLAAIRQHDVTHVSATPTYWRFLLAELAAEGGRVPRLVQATLGGEAVPADLLEQVRATFPGVRVSQIYAASELGQGVTTRDGVAGLPVSLLDAGDDAPLAVRIVDGELHARSASHMLGYFGEDDADPEWRPTGDLVEVVGDRIEFRGRTSEVINVGGVKVHPLPVEQRISGLPGITVARVFGRPNKMVGAIVAVEAVATEGADVEALDAAVREACADLPPAARPRSIRFVESLATAGHKITRIQA